MAGLGRLPVSIPDKVQAVLQNGNLTIQGEKGKMSLPIDHRLTVQVTDKDIVVARAEETRQAKSLHGLTRKLVANMVQGVSTGFARTLEITGVGYRAELVGKSAILFNLGYSHPILFQLPNGITAKIERNTIVTVEGMDKQLLGEVAVKIRQLRPPDPYKAKGIKFAGEVVRRKAGKAAGTR